MSSPILSLTGKPIITRVSSSDNAKVGFSALLTCEADGENVTWSWYHNGKNISGNRFQPSPIGGSLSIKSLQLSDIGTYKCVASNRLGNEEAPLQLSISGKNF